MRRTVGDIADPDLIGSTDLKVLNSIDPGTLIFKGSRGLTDAFHRYREIFFFHQPGNPFISDGVSLMQEQRSDAPIPVCRIRPSSSLYFRSQDVFRRVEFGLIIEGALVETQRLTNLSHGILLAQRLNDVSLLRAAVNPITSMLFFEFPLTGSTAQRAAPVQRYARSPHSTADPQR